MKIKTKKNKENNSSILKVKPFIRLLKRIHLGGIIDEFVFQFKNNDAIVESIDLTNSIIVFSNETILKSSLGNLKLGFGNVEVLLKFLSTIPDSQILIENQNNKLIFKRKDSKRSLIYLIKDPEVIPGALRDNEKKEDFLDLQEYSIPLNQVVVKDILSYISSLKTKTVTINYNRKDGVEFVCGDKNEHQLKIVIDDNIKKIDRDASKNISISINGEFLSKILNVLEFDETDNPILYFANENPIVVQSQNTYWALKPIMEEKS